VTTEKPAPRPELPPPPPRVARLPVDARGYPVPFFVAWVGGKPEFRVADPAKFRRAVADKLCWVCGDPLGVYRTFVIGPMSAVTRTSAEPPCHRECAEYSARACPFLTKPHMVRREGGLPEGCRDPAGEMIRRNPGVVCLWPTRTYALHVDGRGGVLIEIGDPAPPYGVTWHAEGRAATRAEVLAAIDSGLPILRGMAEADGPKVVEQLGRMHARALLYLPPEGGAA
jgi:hypothetical protein